MKAFAAVVLMTALLLPADALAGTETVLFSFDLTDGGNPQGILARDSAGNLYGVTQIGGSCGDGTVFRLAGTNETVLHSFGCVNDRHLPIGPVVLDPNGNIYGTTYSFSDADCGTVFRISGSRLVTLHSFTCGSDGGPTGPVTLDSAGNIYGLTSSGGVYGGGTAFRISSSGVFSVLYNFCASNCVDGSGPGGRLVIDKKGNLYGMTGQGGTSDLGVVFQLARVGTSWKESVLHNFTSGPNDGSGPGQITLRERTIGNKTQILIFGETLFGGTAGLGTVFQLFQSNSGYVFSLVHSFTGSSGGDGAFPGDVVTIIGGKIFGTTADGGAFGQGTVFQLTRGSQGWTEDILYSFTGGADGAFPNAGVLPTASGMLYGATGGGGIGDCEGSLCGVIYEVLP